MNYFTIQQVAELLQLNLSQVKNLTNGGQLMYKLEDGKTLISADSLANLIGSNEKYAQFADKVDLIRNGTLPGITDVFDGAQTDVTKKVQQEVKDVKNVVTEKISAVPPTVETAKVEQPVAKIASNTVAEKKKSGLSWLLPLIGLLLIGGAIAYFLLGYNKDGTEKEDTTTTTIQPTAEVKSEEVDATEEVKPTEEVEATEEVKPTEEVKATEEVKPTEEVEATEEVKATEEPTE